MRDPRAWLLGVCLFALTAGVLVRAQTLAPSQPTPTTPAAEQPKDALGRSTPRDTVLGFLTASRRGDTATARQYLNTRLNGKAAEELAHQLFLVLDARLAARLTQLSDDPEGSRANPSGARPGGRRRRSPGTRPAWRSSSNAWSARNPARSGCSRRETLDAVPALYQQLTPSRAEAWSAARAFRQASRAASASSIGWRCCSGSPLFYLATSLLNRLLTPAGRGWHGGACSRMPDDGARHALPAPARLLLLARRELGGSSPACPCRCCCGSSWPTPPALVTIVAGAWLLVLLNGEVEALRSSAGFPRADGRGGVPAASRAARVDVLVIFVALLADAPPLRDRSHAGAGRTRRRRHRRRARGAEDARERHRRRVADLRSGGAGRRLAEDGRDRPAPSTTSACARRASARSIARSSACRTARSRTPASRRSRRATSSGSIPSSGFATIRRPNSCRRSSTASDGLLSRIARSIADRCACGSSRLGAFSLDVEVFAYLFARDWTHFLEMQESLLFSVTEIVERAGTQIAFPSQTMYMANAAELRWCRNQQPRDLDEGCDAEAAADYLADPPPGGGGGVGRGSKLPPSARCRLTRCTRCSACMRMSDDCVAFSAS